MQSEKSLMGGGIHRKALSVLMAVVLVLGLNPGLSRQAAYAADGDLSAASLTTQADETVTIGTGTVQTNPSKSNWIDPYMSFYDYGVTEQIYRGSEIGKTGTIKSIGFDVATPNTYSVEKSIKVYMGMTSKAQFDAYTNAEAVRDLVCVFDGKYAYGKAAGWETINLDTPFEYNDSGKNLVVAVLKAESAYLSSVKYNHTNIGQGSSDPVWMKGGDSTSLGTDLNSAIDSTVQSAYASSYRPNIQLTFGGESAAAKYEVVKGAESNGSFTLSATEAAENDTITVTTNPSTGYKVDSVTYTPEGGSATAVTGSDNSYTFAMPAAKITVNVSFVEDSSTGDDPQADFIIKDQTSYETFRNAVNAGNTTASTTALVTEDFSLTLGSNNLPAGTVNQSQGGDSAWGPTAQNPFLGTFNGDGHTITLTIAGMYSNGATTQPPAGLFSVVGAGATVKNVIVKGNIGSESGVKQNSNTASACGAAGGVVGILMGGTVENVANYANVYRNSTVDGLSAAGGIVGYGYGTIKNCANHGIVWSGNWAAGILGRNASSDSTTISDCYNVGTIHCTSIALSSYYYRHAGIASSYAKQNYGASITITNCYNAGTMEWDGSGSDAAGTANYGLVDRTTGTISNSYYLDTQTAPAAGTGAATKALADMQAGGFVTTMGDAYATSTLEGQNTPMLAWEETDEPTPESTTYTITPTCTSAASGVYTVTGGTYTVTHYVTDPDAEQATQQNATSAPEGDAIYIWPAASEGYLVDTVTYNDGADHALTVSGTGSGAYATFTMPAKAVTVTVTFKEASAQTEPTLGLAIDNTRGTTWTMDGGNATKTIDTGTSSPSCQPYVTLSATLAGGSAPSEADVTGGVLKIQWFKKGSPDAQVGADDTDMWNPNASGGPALQTSHGSSISIPKGSAEGATSYYAKATWTLGGEIYTATSPDFIVMVANTYDVTVDSGITSGSVSVSAAKAAAGTEITVIPSPAEGYELDAITVTDEDNGSVTVTGNRFTMPAKSVTVSATFKATGATGDTFKATDNPATITTQNDWNNFVTAVNNGNSFEGKTVKLAGDVSANKMVGTVALNSYYVSPTAEATKVFKGSFDGGKHAIAVNITADADSAGVGLFAGVYGDATTRAEVKNLKVTGSVTVPVGIAVLYTGGVVGVGEYLNITDVSTDVTVADNGNQKNGYGAAGGILGAVAGAFMNYSKDEVDTTSIVGCASRGSVTSAGNYAGGIVGSLQYWNAYIGSCYSVGSLSASSQSAGRIAGRTNNELTSTFDACYGVGSQNPVGTETAAAQKNNCTFVTTANASTLSVDGLNANVQKSSDSAAKAETFAADPSDAQINSGMPVLQWEIEAPAVTTWTVTFNADNGSQAVEAKVTKGESVAEPSEPSKSGYIFDGWYNGDSKIIKFPYTPTADVTLTAKWTLDIKDMQAAISAANAELAKVGEGKDIVVAENASDVEAGKKFVTSADKATFETAIETAKTALKTAEDKGTGATDTDKDALASAVTALTTATTTFTGAVKTGTKAPTAYAITIAPSEHGTVKAEPTSAVEGAKVSLTVVPDEGYEIDSLSVTKTGEPNTEVALSGNDFTMPAYGVTVTATFTATGGQTTTTYTVTFDSDGGSAVNPQTIESGKTASYPDEPTKDGYTFGGWKLGDAAYDFGKAVTSDITLKAVWAVDLSKLVKGIQVAKDELGAGDFAVADSAADVRVGEHYVTTAEKNTFEEAIEAAEAAYKNSTTAEAAKAATDTIATATSTFKTAKEKVGANTKEEATVEADAGVTATGYALETDDPDAKVELTVEDKADDAAYGEKIADDYKNDVSADNKVSGVYEVNLSVTKAGETTSLNNKAGSMKLTFPVANVEDGTTVQVIQLHYDKGTETPVKVIYYPKAKGGTVTITLMGFLSTFIVTVPQDTPETPETQKYTVTFDSDGGTTVEPQTVESGKTATAPTAPTKSGYTFKEWTLDDAAYDFAKAVTSDITLKAKWEEEKDATDDSGNGGSGGNNGGNNANNASNGNNNASNGSAANTNAGSSSSNSSSSNATSGNASAGQGSQAGQTATATTTAVAKSANTLKVKAKKVTLKAKKLAKKKQAVKAKKAFTVSGAQGKVTYKVAKYDKKAKKKIKVSKAGKVTVKKGLKKGTYKLKVKVTAAGDATHASATKTVTLKVKVK